jgi:hypothetical protein
VNLEGKVNSRLYSQAISHYQALTSDYFKENTL